MTRTPVATGFTLFVFALTAPVGGCGDGDGNGAGGADTLVPGDAVADAADTVQVEGSPLPACDGPALIYVESRSGERELVASRGGDAVLRGYLRCDGDVGRFRIVSSCGGGLTARLTWANEDTQLAVTLRADEVDGGTLSDGPVTVTLPMAELADADASGDYALDADVSCVSGEATAWQLDLDTTSTGTLPKADNGWPEDLMPGGWSSCEGDRFPYYTGVRDQYGAAVTPGQFYGDMVVYAISGVWCGPCQDAAAEARELHDRLEAKSDEWGFTLVEVLAEDAQSRPTFGPEAPAWAEAYDLVEPVLVGASLSTILTNACIEANAVPAIVVVDPLGKVRRVTTGAATLAALEFTIENDWRAFRAEHPEWVSPRCAGVAGAEHLCPCDAVDAHGDADGDGVSDACDVCASGNDREDFDGDGVPNACDDTPGESPIPQYRPIGHVVARFEGALDADGAILGTAKVSLGFYDESETRMCGVSRPITQATRLTGELGDDVLLGLNLPTTALDFAGSLSCPGILDQEVWGSWTDGLKQLPSGFTIDDRCPIEGCDGRDDPIFAYAAEEVCSGGAAACVARLIGASPWTARDGVIRGPGGASLGFVRAYQLNASNGPNTSAQIDAATLRAGLPEAYYDVMLVVPGSEAERFTGDL